MVELKTILVEYAQQRGGGLPLSAEEICNAVVMWCQKYVKDNTNQDTINAELLKGLIDGSETVVVDLNESGDKLEIHLDSETIADISRSLKLPLARPTEDVIVGVDDSNSQVLLKIGSGLYIDGDTINAFVEEGLYQHNLLISIGQGSAYAMEGVIRTSFINKDPTSYTNFNQIVEYINEQKPVATTQNSEIGASFIVQRIVGAYHNDPEQPFPSTIFVEGVVDRSGAEFYGSNDNCEVLSIFDTVVEL